MPGFVKELSRIALQSHRRVERLGAYYGGADGLSPGAGLIYSGVAYTVFNSVSRRFEARKGPVLVLTHECDIDPNNQREFNEYFVFAPLILMSGFASYFEALGLRETAKSLVAEVAKDGVNRLLFLPPASQFINAPELEDGAVIYWNQLGSTHVGQLSDGDARAMCALSEHALDHVDLLFKQHFLRPKSDQLPRLA